MHNESTPGEKPIKIILSIFFSLFFFQACTSTKDRFKGEIAEPDQIHVIASGANSGVWNTKELSVNYLYTSSLPDNFNLTGYISISEHITNTYSQIRMLNVQVSFLDNNGKVVSTNNIHPIYSVNSNPPKKIKFNSILSLPVEAVAFCFSYSGEFRGDRDIKEPLYIGQNPFH